MTKLSRIAGRVRKSTFVKNVAVLSGGTAMAQLIALFSAPIISRLYEPSDFGILAIYIISASILNVVSALTYERALVLPGEQKQANALLLVCFIALTTITAFAVLLFTLLHDDIAILLDAPQVSFWLLFVPITVFVSGLTLILRNWLIRSKSFKSLAAAGFITAGSTALFKILAGLFWEDKAGGLILATLAGFILSALYLVFMTYRTARPKIRNTTIADLKSIAYEYRKFPLYNSWSNLLNVISQRGITLLFAGLYPPDQLGSYAYAKALLDRPIQLVAQSVNKVYLIKAAQEVNRNKAIISGFMKITAGLAAIGFIPFLIAGLFGNHIFAFVLGEQWFESGRYAQLLSPWLFMLFINRPATGIYTVLQKLELLLYYNILLNISRFSVVFAGWYFWNSSYVSIALFSAIGIAFNLFYIGYAYFLARQNQNSAKTLAK